MENLSVVGITMVGGAYHNGRYCHGWNVAILSDGTKRFVSDTLNGGINRILDYCDSLGFDTAQYRKRLDIWVKTGKMPA